MKKNTILESIRQNTTPDVKLQVDLCVGIANRVYELLEQKGMNQKEFAHKLGKTETEVSRWLSGTHNLTIATIAKMAVELGDNLITPTSNELKSAYNMPANNVLSFAAAEDAPSFNR